MLIKVQDTKKKLLTVIICLVGFLIMLATVHFLKPDKTYGCTIQFIDSAANKVLLRVEAMCSDDSTATPRNLWHETTFYNIDVIPVE